MPRSLFVTDMGLSDYAIRPINLGGTDADNAQDALTNLGMVPDATVNTAHGPLSLDAKGIASASMIAPTVNGDLTVFVNSVNTYTITNYDSRVTYTLMAQSGTVSHVDDTITYTAPTTPGNGGFSINNKAIHLQVISPYISQPSITSPVNGANNLTGTVVFTCSPFVVNGISDTHQSSTWQLATDSMFNTIIASVTNDTVNKTTWTVNGLLPGTRYYVRVLQTGITLGNSAWSNVTTFDTRAVFYPAHLQSTVHASDYSTAGQAYFGYSVDISNDGATAVIGAYNSNVYGQVYVFVLSNGIWVQQQILVASDKNNQTLAYYGYSVAISGDGNTIVVGAYGANIGTYTSAGQVYVYTRSGTVWTQQQILVPISGTQNNLSFGKDVAITDNGNIIIVGVPNAITSGYSNAGSLHTYSRNGSTWSNQQVLVASDYSANAQFGSAVAISGDGSRIVVSAPNAASGGYAGAGQVYTYTVSNGIWVQKSILFANNRNTNFHFGLSLDIDQNGNTLIVGAVNTYGAVYMYTLVSDIWTLQSSVSASSDSNGLGTSVSISSDGNTALIGAPTSTAYGTMSVYTRSGSTWTLKTTINSPMNPTANNYFSRSVAISGDGYTGITGEDRYNTGGYISSGQAYFFA